MDALKTDYYFLGDHLWGDYGFYDAFDVAAGLVGKFDPGYRSGANYLYD